MRAILPEGYPQIVEGRFTQVMGPPQPGVLHDQISPGLEVRLLILQGNGVLGDRFPCRSRGERDGCGQGLVGGESFRLYSHGHYRPVACAVDLQRVEVNAADRSPALPPELDGAPDAYRGQPRAPVPAEAELGLAHGDAFGVATPLVGGSRARVIERSVETEGQRVWFSGAHPTAHLEDRLPEHVAVPTDLFAVEPDLHEGVHPVEDEEQPLVGLKGFRRTFERETVPPLPLFHPGASLFVAVVEGIFYSPGVHQRPVNIPGDRDIYPVAGVESLREGARGDALTRSEILQLRRVEHPRRSNRFCAAARYDAAPRTDGPPVPLRLLPLLDDLLRGDVAGESGAADLQEFPAAHPLVRHVLLLSLDASTGSPSQPLDPLLGPVRLDEDRLYAGPSQG